MNTPPEKIAPRAKFFSLIQKWAVLLFTFVLVLFIICFVKIYGEFQPHKATPAELAELSASNNLANALLKQSMSLTQGQKYWEAEAAYRAVLKLQGRVLEAEHPDVLQCRTDLATTLVLQGKHSAAETEYRAVIKVKERVLGPEHPETLFSIFDLVLCLGQQNKLKEAVGLGERVQSGLRKVLGLDHPRTKQAEQGLELIKAKK